MTCENIQQLEIIFRVPNGHKSDEINKLPKIFIFIDVFINRNIVVYVRVRYIVQQGERSYLIPFNEMVEI